MRHRLCITTTPMRLRDVAPMPYGSLIIVDFFLENVFTVGPIPHHNKAHLVETIETRPHPTFSEDSKRRLKTCHHAIGDVHKKKEIVQDVSLHDLDVANARPQGIVVTDSLDSQSYSVCFVCPFRWFIFSMINARVHLRGRHLVTMSTTMVSFHGCEKENGFHRCRCFPAKLQSAT